MLLLHGFLEWASLIWTVFIIDFMSLEETNLQWTGAEMMRSFLGALWTQGLGIITWAEGGEIC